MDRQTRNLLLGAAAVTGLYLLFRRTHPTAVNVVVPAPITGGVRALAMSTQGPTPEPDARSSVLSLSATQRRQMAASQGVTEAEFVRLWGKM